MWVGKKLAASKKEIKSWLQTKPKITEAQLKKIIVNIIRDSTEGTSIWYILWMRLFIFVENKALE
jgi:hypothetical protein